MMQASVNPALLHNLESVKLLSNVLKTNVSAHTLISGEAYTVQVSRIFMDMLGLYKAVSRMISEVVEKEGLVMSKTPKVRQLRVLKNDILKLTQTYINSVIQIEVVNENFIPPPLDAVLGDYQRRAGGGGAGAGANINTVALPAASREAEMLNLMSNVVRCLGSLITPQVLPILSAVLEPTLEMIMQELTEYPDHRLYYFRLLRMIILNCFPGETDSFGSEIDLNVTGLHTESYFFSSKGAANFIPMSLSDVRHHRSLCLRRSRGCAILLQAVPFTDCARELVCNDGFRTLEWVWAAGDGAYKDV
ncbi:hypothetical protein GYMLUDRAFT_829578 [Collybiopsis luxurians FD-317 M1]|uniref:Exportin-1 C-terminal domain-containing protein n=1 Tax=Collybiopsis luxurians FD-317 M1 TaxID=944289 RepID=A0A0D0CLL1_9AGAR|nr:hypothetical protein GYMLUDRAFT_829578 [Collybiopsis luxurians FD-317 M1]